MNGYFHIIHGILGTVSAFNKIHRQLLLKKLYAQYDTISDYQIKMLWSATSQCKRCMEFIYAYPDILSTGLGNCKIE